MNCRENWIWLPEKSFPDRQTTFYSPLARTRESCYTVARFARTYEFGKKPVRMTLRVSGDSAFRLYAGDALLCRGPAWVGGDFLDNETPRPNWYAYELTLSPESAPGLPLWDGTVCFSAEVRMQPVRICEYSKGHGGFFLDGLVTFDDGTVLPIGTDERWSAKLLGAYAAPGNFDNGQADSEAVPAARTQNLWHCEAAPIPPCSVTPLPFSQTIAVPAGETVKAKIPFDMVYACYLTAAAKTSGELTVSVRCSENGESGSGESFRFVKDGAYSGFELHSAGELWVEAVNHGSEAAELTVGAEASSYPVTVEAITETSDPELNDVLKVCRHTLRQCRQSIHLDSPRHCEPSACTGDYYIEALMTAFTFGDLRLAAFDVRRTAELLRYHDGRMFHTTYSLIWVRMLWEVYFLTGERALLADCEDALTLLLNRFGAYLGENGLIEIPPDYMFIDWLCPDGISTHHPPKALGQTCLNLYYFGALNTAAKVYAELNRPAMAEDARSRAAKVKEAVLSLLYDPEKKLFFEGLNTPTPEEMLYQYLPANVEKRYYRKHANILAAYFRLIPEEEARDLLRRILSDDSLGEVQPYFQHFLLDAVYRNGLRDESTLNLLEQWKAPVKECAKGLAEGFIKPEPGYRFDHSHAWGGTPAYALPLALTGIRLIEPGWKKIRLSPSLLGLEWAKVEIPTPYGMIVVEQKKGQPPVITLPDGVEMVEA